MPDKPTDGTLAGTAQGQPAAAVQPEKPAGATVPDGMVLVEKATHDAQGGELRRAKRDLAKSQDADAERERTERETAAKEAGDYEKLAGIEAERREKLEKRLRRAELGDALRDEISGRGFSGEKAAALKRLVDPDTVQYSDDNTPLSASLMVAVDRVVGAYPTMFGKEEKPASDEQPGRTARPRGPSTPPADAAKQPADFVSQEEYTNTPWETRMTPEFQERVSRSEHLWPKTVHRSTFQQAPG
jgi:hypothetical protein